MYSQSLSLVSSISGVSGSSIGSLIISKLTSKVESTSSKSQLESKTSTKFEIKEGSIYEAMT